MKTAGLLIGLWLVCGVIAEAVALDRRPLKLERIVEGPIALARQLELI